MDSHLLDTNYKAFIRKQRRDKVLMGLFLAIYLPLEIVVSLLLAPFIMPFLKPSKDEL